MTSFPYVIDGLVTLILVNSTQKQKLFNSEGYYGFLFCNIDNIISSAARTRLAGWNV